MMVDGFSQNMQPSYSSAYINRRNCIKVICHFICLSYYIQNGTSQSKIKQYVKNSYTEFVTGEV